MDESLEGHAFFRNMDEGQIHHRDRLQFSLKSEFKTSGEKKPSGYLQELYLFIPESLQINPSTYSKNDFYHDETFIIRYKTPSFTFEELDSETNFLNPLVKISWILDHLNDTIKKDDTPTKISSDSEIILELKMYGNIYRSTLREAVKSLLSDHSSVDEKALNQKLEEFARNIQKAREAYDKIRVRIDELTTDEKLHSSAQLVDEFMSLATEYHVLGLLYFLDRFHLLPGYTVLKERLINEKKRNTTFTKKTFFEEEEQLMHASELNRFLYDALSLKYTRIEIQKKHGNYIGMVAAGSAMLVYITLFVWKATTFGINSVPFVLFAVVFYILKDRIKEGLKEFYYKNAYRWFPDFSTEITTPADEPVGTINESFQFITNEKVPSEFRAIRSKGNEDQLELSESIIQYKRELTFKSEEPLELNTIFRFNIHRFIEKAGDDRQKRFVFDPITENIVEKELPKIYVITVLLRDTFENRSQTKKFQIILKKSGIERVKFLGSYS